MNCQPDLYTRDTPTIRQRTPTRALLVAVAVTPLMMDTCAFFTSLAAATTLAALSSPCPAAISLLARFDDEIEWPGGVAPRLPPYEAVRSRLP